MKNLARLLIVGLVLSLFPFSSVAGAQQKEILIGLIPEMNVFKQRERFKPLAEYLTKKTGVKVNLTILSRYGNIIERFTSEKMDGAFFGSFTGALAIQKLGVVPLARPMNLDGSTQYWGYLFVRKDSGIRSVKDMKGKKMAYVEKATTAGYVFPVAYFKDHGVKDPNKFFSDHFFAGSHDAAIYAVLDRKADVGAAKHSMYDRVRKADPRVDKELVILAESAKVPSNGLCVRKGLDKNIQKKLKEALLNIDKDPEGKVVLQKFGGIKFIETTVADYNPVFDIARKAGIDIKKYVYRNE
ncbi:MAG: phosphate/phosphite/phosphonate ABC transporter substrate-binding protein [Nitrospiraceae bacterium]|nr:phosphate/phosphite/phosphonate ABC transporter substrate-binding protein [Nitrospiraceae bacterium]